MMCSLKSICFQDSPLSCSSLESLSSSTFGGSPPPPPLSEVPETVEVPPRPLNRLRELPAAERWSLCSSDIFGLISTVLIRWNVGEYSCCFINTYEGRGASIGLEKGMYTYKTEGTVQRNSIFELNNKIRARFRKNRKTCRNKTKIMVSSRKTFF